jgi:sigma-B regulation protein RsbU (phosphoserine phosphatase)
LQRRGPGDALAFVNGVVLQEQEHDDPRFCSAVFARLEPEEGGLELCVCSAGHPPALVLRASGTVEECHSPGTLLGIVSDPDLTGVPITLASGDALVLYTDGLTEARSPAAGLLGEERVRELLAASAGSSAEEPASGLVDLAATSNDGRRRDDLALLVLRER